MPPKKKPTSKKSPVVKKKPTPKPSPAQSATKQKPALSTIPKPLEKLILSEMVELSSLKLNPDNPRFIKTEAFQLLKDSLKRDPKLLEFRPLVIDADGTILGGNQRYRALKELGYKDISNLWVKDGSWMTTEQKRRFILLDNSPKGMSGEFDYEILANGWEPRELIELGFTNEQLGLTIDDNGDGGTGDPGQDAKTVECPFCLKSFEVDAKK